MKGALAYDIGLLTKFDGSIIIIKTGKEYVHFMEDLGTLERILKAAVDVKLTPLLWGRHGIGKSAIIRSMFEAEGYEVIDLRLGQLEVGDLVGIPAQEFYCPMCETKFGISIKETYCPICAAEGNQVPIAGQTVWLPPSWFPQNGEKRLIFFDELNRGRLDVQQATFQIVLDRRIHTHKVPDNCGIICACNPSGGDYIVEELDPALLDRFINVKWTLTTRQWLRWARDKGAIMPEIVDFINTDDKYLGNQAVQIPIDVQPSPRSYEFLSKMLSALPKNHKIWTDVAVCILGEHAALSFMQSLKEDVEKPIKAEEIFLNWAKVKPKVKKQSASAEKGDTRHDLLRATIDELYDMVKDGKSSHYTIEQYANVAEFLLMIPKDLSFSALKDLSPLPEIHEKLLMQKAGEALFDILKEARNS